MANFITNTSLDPLHLLTFGGSMSATNMKKINNTALQGTGSSDYNISIVINSAKSNTDQDWLNGVANLEKTLAIGDGTARSKYNI